MLTMIMFHVPEDRDILAAYGELGLRHEHLTYILRMTIRTLARLEISEALDATAYDGAALLRDRIRKLARHRLGEGEPLLKLQAILERCKRATEKRNDLIHSVWAKELDGETVRHGNDHKWQSIPTVQELKTLGNEIYALTESLNSARLDGFLSEALEKRTLP